MGAIVFAITGIVAFSTTGWLTFLPILFSFVFIPLAELVLPPCKSVSATEPGPEYNILLYSVVPIQYGLLLLFLLSMSEPVGTFTAAGRVLSMGLLCGVYGINVAHELGHRKKRSEQIMAQMLLLTSVYQHFFIEHNRGHHKRVGTPEDPATARKGENVYRFWLRVIPQSFLSAWNLEKGRLKRIGISIWSHQNQMIRFLLVQLTFVLSVFLVFGIKVTAFFLVAAGIGIVLLETINYIEHYGLMRNKISDASYERVQPIHSWNSDHLMGRYLLFELTRHSDHHSNSQKPYPTLESRENASQLPTGYPAMMLLSLAPPLWFKVMDHRLPKG